MARTSAAPNREILEAALQGLEAQKQKLDEQIAQVRAMMGRRVGRPPRNGGDGAAHSTGAQSAARKKRVLSAEARKRIAAAQKKRWAAFRKSQ
jgi:hypothetical protein